MTIYHRHLDHDWQCARRETNYALFGNSRGDTVATNHTGRGKSSAQEMTLARQRSARWSCRYQTEEQNRLYGKPYDERMFSIAYWMWTENSDQWLDESGHGYYLIGRNA